MVVRSDSNVQSGALDCGAGNWHSLHAFFCILGESDNSFLAESGDYRLSIKF